MCSKPIFAHAERSARTCSSPHKTKLGVKRKATTGQGKPFFSAKDVSVLLFKSPSSAAQVCCAPQEGVTPILQTAQGLHLEQLRKAFSRCEVCHYEWYWEKESKACTCRTTLLPLTGPTGHVTEVMAITRDISQWGDVSHAHQILREGSAPKTFAQILLSARESEKREVAKALHDEIGTASVMLSALLNLTKQSVHKGDESQIMADLERLQTQIQQSMQRLHSIVVSLRPPSLDTDGALRGSLETLVGDICTLGRISYQFKCAKNMSEKGISDQVKILLYRIVQEALSNVVKHAHANQVVVSLKRAKGQLFLTVQDNGVGFLRSKVNSIEHVGLLAMKNSVLLLGGHLKISSKPEKGTCISAVCPCVVYEGNL